MATSSEIDTYIAAIEAFLASNIGVTSIKHPDGRSLNLDRKQALVELTYWNTQKNSSNSQFKMGRSRLGLKGDA